jgi:mannose/fructose/N-acetylgalactosamine-specific phosphotransferase system component IIC
MGSINLEEVNGLAVVVAALGTFMIGGSWYTALFGKAWQKAHGFSQEQVKQMQAATPPAIFFGSMLVCYFLVALGIALVAQLAGVNSLANGATLGFIVWIVVAAVGWTNHIPTNVANAGYFIDVSYQLIYLVGTGAVIGAWQ